MEAIAKLANRLKIIDFSGCPSFATASTIYVYRAPSGFVNLLSLRRRQIDLLRSPCTECNVLAHSDRFCFASPSPNSQNLMERGINKSKHYGDFKNLLLCLSYMFSTAAILQIRDYKFCLDMNIFIFYKKLLITIFY